MSEEVKEPRKEKERTYYEQVELYRFLPVEIRERLLREADRERKLRTI